MFACLVSMKGKPLSSSEDSVAFFHLKKHKGPFTASDSFYKSSGVNTTPGASMMFATNGVSAGEESAIKAFDSGLANSE